MSEEVIPPQSIETEQEILGVIMKDPNAFEVIVSHLSDPDQFYSPKHQMIFNAALCLRDARESVDIQTLSDELMKQGKLREIGGRVYLVELVEGVISSVNCASHARIIAEKASYRQQIQVYADAQALCYSQSEDPSSILASVSQKMSSVGSGQGSSPFRKLSSYMADVFKHCQEIQESKKSLGVPYGFAGIDKMTGGAQPGDLVIIAGRPSMGKTALMNCMAMNQCASGHKIAVFSAETGGDDYALRSLCTEGKVDSIDIKQGKTSTDQWEKLTAAMTSMHPWEYWIDDTPGIDIHELVSKASRLKREEGIEVIYVDYIQTLTFNNEHMQKKEKVDTILTALKRLAQTLHVPVVVLSQLSRDMKTRRSKIPTLFDLKESGNIEQDADFVIALYRPEIYATKAQQQQGKFKNLNEIHILKQRNGPVGVVDLFFNEVHTRFEDMPEISEIPGEDNPMLPF